MNPQKKIYAGAMLAFCLAFSAKSLQAQTCIVPPSCEELGYTMTEADCASAEKILKCPHDQSKMFCLTMAEIDPGSSGNVGDILYGDGTVSSKQIFGKKPIGVVFDVFNRLAIAVTDVKQDGSAGSETMQWSSEDCDTPNLENCTDGNAICGTDGRANTDAILATNGGCGGTTYAANAVNNYQISGCSKDFCKQGKWFLPSFRDLDTIYRLKSTINSRLTSLPSVGAWQLTEGEYWSSTEYSYRSAWSLEMDSGNRGSSRKRINHYVRPVIAF